MAVGLQKPAQDLLPLRMPPAAFVFVGMRLVLVLQGRACKPMGFSSAAC